VQSLSRQFDELTRHVDGIKNQLEQDIEQNANNIQNLGEAIQNINQEISDINEALRTINVDQNIHDWVEQNLGQSSTIYFKDVTETVVDPDTGEETTNVIFQVMEIKISQAEKNAIILKEDGLYVEDFSQDINNLKEHQE
jgi:ABC-type transporter Mla subunit MlaD